MWSCEYAHTFEACAPVHVMCASVWYVHIHMLHAVKTSVCGVCHYRQP